MPHQYMCQRVQMASFVVFKIGAGQITGKSPERNYQIINWRISYVEKIRCEQRQMEMNQIRTKSSENYMISTKYKE